jgi:SRSO17 transposase
MMLKVMDGYLSECDARLREWLDSLGHLFARPEPREVFAALVEGMLSRLEKKNGWTLAQHAGHTHPGRIQSFLNRGAWNADDLEAEIRRYVVAELGCPDAVLVIDDTQIIKKGTRSVGVAPQHCGSTNQTENCQVTVLLTYAGTDGHAVIGHRLYLPARWTEDRDRCREAGIPDTVGFATKLDLAVELLAEALDAQVPLRWVAMDGGYGQYPQIRNWCASRALSYIAAVCSTLPLVQISPTRTAITCAKDLLATLGAGDFERRSCGQGAKGQRFYDWAFIELASNLRVKDERPADGFTHTLLVRRSVADPSDLTFFLAHAPVATPLPALVVGAGTRWKIEEDNKTEKDLLGLSHYQVRTWTAWHHNIVICMLAHAFLAAAQARLLRERRDQAAVEDADQGKVPQQQVGPAQRIPTG